MSSPEITIKNSDVLVKWMYKSENVFRFDDVSSLIFEVFKLTY